MRYFKINQLEIKQGNKKLGNNTLIFNMNSAHFCPSKRLGLCEIPDGLCYAFKDEKRYKDTLAYRMRQADYWNNTTAENIWVDLLELFTAYPKLRKTIKYFRFNESGDFRNQDDIKKLDFISIRLNTMFNIVTYGYSARKDLNFDKVSFRVKGSSHSQGNSGICIARNKKLITSKKYRENDKVYYLCPMDCRKCKLCKSEKSYNVVIALH